MQNAPCPTAQPLGLEKPPSPRPDRRPLLGLVALHLHMENPGKTFQIAAQRISGSPLLLNLAFYSIVVFSTWRLNNIWSLNQGTRPSAQGQCPVVLYGRTIRVGYQPVTPRMWPRTLGEIEKLKQAIEKARLFLAAGPKCWAFFGLFLGHNLGTDWAKQKPE